jgi:hypothetical protein
MTAHLKIIINFLLRSGISVGRLKTYITAELDFVIASSMQDNKPSIAL